MNWSGNFREGLAREIRENKTLAKITAYTVFTITIHWLYYSIALYNITSFDDVNVLSMGLNVVGYICKPLWGVLKNIFLYLYGSIYFLYKKNKTRVYIQSMHWSIQNNEIRLDCPTQLCLHDTAVLPRGSGLIGIINSIYNNHSYIHLNRTNYTVYYNYPFFFF